MKVRDFGGYKLTGLKTGECDRGLYAYGNITKDRRRIASFSNEGSGFPVNISVVLCVKRRKMIPFSNPRDAVAFARAVQEE